MPSSKCFITILAFLTVLASTRADEKKYMTVASGEAATKVNNHYWSYTTPGQSSTNCSGYGTVDATATATSSNTANVNGTVNTTTNCNSTYRPPQTTNGNRITVDNSAWVTDTATGDQYLIECTANWRGSKCSRLTGGTYKAALEGNTMWITGMKGMKEMTAKYKVWQFAAAPPQARAHLAATLVSASAVASAPFTADETYAWETYKSALPEDKDYIRVFCVANAKGSALIPRADIAAGKGAQHAVDCAAWMSAKSKAD
jgi:hypothetical protein